MGTELQPFIWLGILFCVSQSAIFSGLNLAYFSITKLRLEIEIKNGNTAAARIAGLRQDANFLLATILWGNVGINVLLTLLSNSVMAGLTAFVFSTFVITFLGEIIPQAYFSRNAMRMGALMTPVIRFYQVLLYPVAKPTALFLDRWLGGESMQFYQEKDLRELLQIHVDASETNIAKFEGHGALNFLDLDDLTLTEEGEALVPESIIALEFEDGRPVFPPIAPYPEDPFLRRVNRAHKKWIVLTNMQGEPRLTLDSDAFLRAALFSSEQLDPLEHCHRPIVFYDSKKSLADAISLFHVESEKPGDDVIDKDIILYWGERKQVITGSDILGRLLRGIVIHKEVSR